MTTLYLDNDVTLKASVFLRAAGFEVEATRDLGRENASDEGRLLYAAQHGWAFVTHNEADFTLLHDAWQHWATAWGVVERHAGILIIPQGRKYGIDWRAARIAEEIARCLQINASLTNALFRRKEDGWQRRSGKDWTPRS